MHVHSPRASGLGAPARREQREGGDARKMASGNAKSNVVAFPDLPPRGSRSYGGGKRALLGPEIGTQFLKGRLRSAAVRLLRRG